MARIDDKPLYVLGFAFSADLNHVWLIQKTRPEWQRGLFNGVGGKVESFESPAEAMAREFQEETGERITAWQRFAFMSAGNAHIFCFACTVPEDQHPHTTTDEIVSYVRVADIHINGSLPMIGNIPWLVHMAQACLRKTMTGFPLLIQEA